MYVSIAVSVSAQHCTNLAATFLAITRMFCIDFLLHFVIHVDVS